MRHDLQFADTGDVSGQLQAIEINCSYRTEKINAMIDVFASLIINGRFKRQLQEA